MNTPSLMAWRGWQVRDPDPPFNREPALVSYTRLWQPGENRPNAVPSPDNQAGFYGTWHGDAVLDWWHGFSIAESFAIGQVELWGAVVEHGGGYRAEFAAVHSIDALVRTRMSYPPGWRLALAKLIDIDWSGTAGDDDSVVITDFIVDGERIEALRRRYLS